MGLVSTCNYLVKSHTHTVREDMLGKPRRECPSFIDYTLQNGMKSLYNTPNTWGIYILNLVLKWIEKRGGVLGTKFIVDLCFVSWYMHNVRSSS